MPFGDLRIKHELEYGIVLGAAVNKVQTQEYFKMHYLNLSLQEMKDISHLKISAFSGNYGYSYLNES